MLCTPQVLVAIGRMEKSEEVPYLNLKIKTIGTRVVMRTFDMMADAYLGAVCVQQLQYRCEETDPLACLT